MEDDDSILNTADGSAPDTGQAAQSTADDDLWDEDVLLGYSDASGKQTNFDTGEGHDFSRMDSFLDEDAILDMPTPSIMIPPTSTETQDRNALVSSSTEVNVAYRPDVTSSYGIKNELGDATTTSQAQLLGNIGVCSAMVADSKTPMQSIHEEVHVEETVMPNIVESTSEQGTGSMASQMVMSTGNMPLSANVYVPAPETPSIIDSTNMNTTLAAEQSADSSTANIVGEMIPDAEGISSARDNNGYNVQITRSEIARDTFGGSMATRIATAVAEPLPGSPEPTTGANTEGTIVDGVTSPSKISTQLSESLAREHDILDYDDVEDYPLMRTVSSGSASIDNVQESATKPITVTSSVTETLVTVSKPNVDETDGSQLPSPVIAETSSAISPTAPASIQPTAASITPPAAIQKVHVNPHFRPSLAGVRLNLPPPSLLCGPPPTAQSVIMIDPATGAQLPPIPGVGLQPALIPPPPLAVLDAASRKARPPTNLPPNDPWFSKVDSFLYQTVDDVEASHPGSRLAPMPRKGTAVPRQPSDRLSRSPSSRRHPDRHHSSSRRYHTDRSPRYRYHQDRPEREHHHRHHRSRSSQSPDESSPPPPRSKHHSSSRRHRSTQKRGASENSPSLDKRIKLEPEEKPEEAVAEKLKDAPEGIDAEYLEKLEEQKRIREMLNRRKELRRQQTARAKARTSSTSTAAGVLRPTTKQKDTIQSPTTQQPEPLMSKKIINLKTEPKELQQVTVKQEEEHTSYASPLKSLMAGTTKANKLRTIARGGSGSIDAQDATNADDIAGSKKVKLRKAIVTTARSEGPTTTMGAKSQEVVKRTLPDGTIQYVLLRKTAKHQSAAVNKQQPGMAPSNSLPQINEQKKGITINIGRIHSNAAAVTNQTTPSGQTGDAASGRMAVKQELTGDDVQDVGRRNDGKPTVAGANNGTAVPQQTGPINNGTVNRVSNGPQQKTAGDKTEASFQQFRSSSLERFRDRSQSPVTRHPEDPRASRRRSPGAGSEGHSQSQSRSPSASPPPGRPRRRRPAHQPSRRSISASPPLLQTYMDRRPMQPRESRSGSPSVDRKDQAHLYRYDHRHRRSRHQHQARHRHLHSRRRRHDYYAPGSRSPPSRSVSRSRSRSFSPQRIRRRSYSPEAGGRHRRGYRRQHHHDQLEYGGGALHPSVHARLGPQNLRFPIPNVSLPPPTLYGPVMPTVPLPQRPMMVDLTVPPPLGQPIPMTSQRPPGPPLGARPPPASRPSIPGFLPANLSTPPPNLLSKPPPPIRKTTTAPPPPSVSSGGFRIGIPPPRADISKPPPVRPPPGLPPTNIPPPSLRSSMSPIKPQIRTTEPPPRQQQQQQQLPKLQQQISVPNSLKRIMSEKLNAMAKRQTSATTQPRTTGDNKSDGLPTITSSTATSSSTTPTLIRPRSENYRPAQQVCPENLTQIQTEKNVGPMVAFIQNIARNTNKEKIESLVCAFDTVDSVELHEETQSATVVFASSSEAEQFKSLFDKRMVDLSKISVELKSV